MLDLFFRKYAWTANLVLLFVAAWFTARMVNTLVGALIRPRPQANLSAPAQPSRQAPAMVLDDARLYHLIGVEPPAQPQAVATETPRRAQNCSDPDAQPVKTELRLSLVGGVVNEIPRYSLATIADPSTNDTHVLGVGDLIGKAQVLGLERIQTDGDITGNGYRLVAVICNEGTKEYVESDPGITVGTTVASAVPNLGVSPVPRPSAPGAGMEGVRAVGNNLYQVDRKVIDSTLSDLNQIATQARIVPSFKNGVANGFKLFSIQPGSLYSAIGIENGDVLQRVNGYEINSPEKALELYQKLRESSHVTIELERNGQPIRKEYNISGS
jgi:general secretion pathway protein C